MGSRGVGSTVTRGASNQAKQKNMQESEEKRKNSKNDPKEDDLVGSYMSGLDIFTTQTILRYIAITNKLLFVIILADSPLARFVCVNMHGQMNRGMNSTNEMKTQKCTQLTVRCINEE